METRLITNAKEVLDANIVVNFGNKARRMVGMTRIMVIMVSRPLQLQCLKMKMLWYFSFEKEDEGCLDAAD